MIQDNVVLLTNMAPMLRYNLANDDFGNIVIVSGSSWVSAYYHVHGALYNGSYEELTK